MGTGAFGRREARVSWVSQNGEHTHRLGRQS